VITLNIATGAGKAHTAPLRADEACCSAMATLTVLQMKFTRKLQFSLNLLKTGTPSTVPNPRYMILPHLGKLSTLC
jgi:hypothetical protein